MDQPDGKATELVAFLERLEQEPHRFDFFQAVRKLDALNTDAPRIGAARSPSDEPVRLGQAPTMAFSPATVAAFEPGTADRPHRLVVQFLGLFGPNGPLPLHWTEYARDRMRNSNDIAFAKFADVFHHRALALFYRAWAAAQPTVQLDRPESDRFAAYVASLFGWGDDSLCNRDAFPDSARRHFAGHFSCQTRHPQGLCNIVEQFFHTPVRLEEFAARWIDLPSDCHMKLGCAENAILGQTAVVGDRVWDCMQTFRLVLGPMPLAQFESFLDGGANQPRLEDLVRSYVGYELGWEVQLVLEREQIPMTRLSGNGRLGWTTWLGGAASRDDDASDLILEPHRGAA